MLVCLLLNVTVAMAFDDRRTPSMNEPNSQLILSVNLLSAAVARPYKYACDLFIFPRPRIFVY